MNLIEFVKVMEKITSRSNPNIKSARALRQRKNRESNALFLVEGIHHVGAAVEADAAVETVFYAPELLKSRFAQEMIEQASGRGIPCYPTSSEVFVSLAGKDNPQGLLAVVHQPQVTLADLNPENFSWGTACVSPQDPGNVGAILRTIDAVGASGLILIGEGVDAYHPTAVRASMGAIFRHPVARSSPPEFSQWVKTHVYQVYGTSAQGELDYLQVTEYKSPAILLMGSEQQGLTPEQAQICQTLIRLPMHGEATSLNLAVAAGVMLYTMLENMESS
jgi:TrmH family RNA methyltransferase